MRGEPSACELAYRQFALGERPARDGRAGSIRRRTVAPWMARQSQRRRHCRVACRTPGQGWPGRIDPKKSCSAMDGTTISTKAALPRGLPNARPGMAGPDRSVEEL